MLLMRPTMNRPFFRSLWACGLMATLLAPTAALAACQFTVNVNNPADAESIAHVTKLGVKVKGGTWRNIQQGGKRVLSAGQTYTESFKPTISGDCDANRRYRAKVKCKKEGGLLGFSSTVSKGWRYTPSETGWISRETVNIDTRCP